MSSNTIIGVIQQGVGMPRRLRTNLKVGNYIKILLKDNAPKPYGYPKTGYEYGTIHRINEVTTGGYVLDGLPLIVFTYVDISII